MNIAHRGFSGRYPENTLTSFLSAIELGCTWLECDVRRTRDGVFVVLHDETVDRTTNGTGRIGELTWDEIRNLDAGSWKSPEFVGVRVPRLVDLLDCISGKAQLVVELKVPPNEVQRIVDVLNDHEARTWCAVSAFDRESLEVVKRGDPGWRTTWLTRFADVSRDEAISRCVTSGIDTLAPLAREIDAALVEAAHEKGLLVRAWGVGEDKGPELHRLISLGVDGATTNHPDVLGEILRS
jgi:glycerophosphoryl diester phosphodiesterase